LREQPSRFGADSTLAAHDFVDALHGHADVLGEGDLGEAERGEEILGQGLARMRQGYARTRNGHEW
jgi:hypothetical protein